MELVMNAQTQEALKIDLENLIDRFNEGWHEGIEIDASDIMLLSNLRECLAQPAQDSEQAPCEQPVAYDKLTNDEKASIKRQINNAFNEGFEKEKAITEGSQLSNLKVSSKSEKPLPPPAPIHTCTYSRTMNQEYPRKCTHCGEVEAKTQPAQEPVLNVEKIINEFPLLDDEGLDEDKHHCEWAIQQDRKRLHAIIKNTHPAPHPAQEPVARIEVFNLLTKNGAFAIKEEWLWNIRYINSKGIIRKFPNEYPSEKKYAIQSAKYWADFLNCKIVEVDNRGNK